MAGEGQTLSHRAALAVAEGRRVVHVVLEHARVRRSQDGEGHLVGDRQERVLEQLEGDGVVRFGGHACLPRCASAPRSMTMLPQASRAARASGGTRQVASYSSTMQGPWRPPASAPRSMTGVSTQPGPGPK